jgi:hypothetical protein
MGLFFFLIGLFGFYPIYFLTRDFEVYFSLEETEEASSSS